MVLVPGVNVTVVSQLVQPLVVDASAPSLLLRRKRTRASCELSPALPLTVNSSLLQRCPLNGAVMARVGRVTSTKLAVNARLEAMRNVRAGLLVVKLPDQFVKA